MCVLEIGSVGLARLPQLARVLQLQRAHLAVERHAAALQLALRVELLEALGVRHELLGEADAQINKLVGPGLLKGAKSS